MQKGYSFWMEPLVSVIIPVYNVRPYLREALESVLGQTYRNLEILIINDGSNDGSEAVCDEYEKKDPRITVVHQENKGLSTARNVGLNRRTGDYVAFLDPDDAFHPDMIWILMGALRRNGAKIAVCGIISSRTEGKGGSTRTVHSALANGRICGANRPCCGAKQPKCRRETAE